MENIKKYILNQLVEQKLSRDDAKQLLNEVQSGQVSPDVAIVGMACQLPGADNKDEYWDLLSNGKSAISTYSESRMNDIRETLGNRFTRQLFFGNGDHYDEDFGLGGFLEDISGFDASFFSISPKEAKFMDPYQRKFLETAWEAVEDAGYGGKRLYGSKTGVFVGRDHAELSSYQLVTEHDPMHFTGSYTGILASRIAYLFHFNGPCAVLDTACSSGLVAVHTACRSLQSGDCDMAIAGGINLRYTPVKEQGLKMIESKDGSVRTFDKDASGTMLSEGVGVVILKPLKNAMQDGDHIYAVIKGSAINNDGASMGLTAPNADAQYQVIQSALKQANVSSETIAYVEAHGTGTVLGDPIEIEGLTRAFSEHTDKKQFCGIGSAKTNIGHAVGASGLAGLIKVVLSMQNKAIPASLNFRESNPYIDFHNSPFYVVNELTPWKESSYPRRAGISSFGFSGTNCHVVLEEAPAVALPVEKESPRNERLIFTLSAKSKESLTQYVVKYIRFLNRPDNRALPLEILCSNTATGRGHYSERLAFSVNSVEELKQKLYQMLDNDDWDQLTGDHIFYGHHRIVPNNKHQLANNELSENRLAELSYEMNQMLLNIGTRANDEANRLLCEGYVQGADIPWELYFRKYKAFKMSLPTYPYERKRYWANALQEELSGTSGIPAGYPLLHRVVINTPDLIVFGSVFNERKDWILHEHRIYDTSLIPGTAYLEMALEAVSKYTGNRAVELNNIYLHTPLVAEHNETIRVQTVLHKISGRYEFKIYSQTGDSGILHAEGTIKEIPSADKRENMESFLSKAVTIHEKLDENEVEQGIYFGARWNNIERVSSLSEHELVVEIVLPEAFHSEAERMRMHPAMLDSAINVLSQRIGKGLYLPYSYKNIKIYASIPTSFYCHMDIPESKESETISFNIRLLDRSGNIVVEIENYTLKKVHNTQLTLKGSKEQYHQVEWLESPELHPDSTIEITGVLLFMHEDNELAQSLCSQLRLLGANVIKVVPGNEFAKTASHEYRIQADSFEDYGRLLQEVSDIPVSHIVHLLHESNYSQLTDETLTRQMNLGVYSLFHLVRAIIFTKRDAGIHLLIAAPNANRITGTEEYLSPTSAALQGFTRVVEQEYSQYPCTFLDYDESVTAEALIAEMTANHFYTVNAQRQGRRLYPALRRADLQIHNQDLGMIVKEGGVYLITGGLGGIGLQLASRMASHKGIHLVLLNRSSFPQPETWNSILQENADSPQAATIRLFQQLEGNGTTVDCFAVDVSDPVELERVLHRIRVKHGTINGIFHAAGIAGQGFIVNKTEKQLQETMKPKINGTYWLDELTKQDDIDFFVLFSSVIALVGGHGQADYAAANSFIDAYASYRNQMGRPFLSINWGMWSEVGMAVDFGVDGRDMLLKPITNDEGFLGLAHVISNSCNGLLIGELNSNYAANLATQLYIPRASAGLESKGGAAHSSRGAVKVVGKTNAEYTGAEKVLAQIWSHLLELDTINVYDNFYDLGGDSILAISLVKMINEKFKANVLIGDVFNSTNIVELAILMEDYDVEVIETTEIVTKEQHSIQKPKPILSPEPSAIVDQPKTVVPEPVSIIHELDEFVIKQKVTDGDNNLTWRQFGCYDRSLTYLMRLSRRDATQYFKLINALQRAFDIQGTGYNHVHRFNKINSVFEYFNQDYRSFIGKFGFDVHFNNIQVRRSLHLTLQNLINEQKLVMLPFDEYYLYYSPYYLKKHTDHYVVVYGYDNKKKLYHILNHNHITRNHNGPIVYGPFVAPFSLVEDIAAGLEPERQYAITVAENDSFEKKEADYELEFRQIIAAGTAQPYGNRDCFYIRKLLNNEMQWDDNSSKEIFDYVGAKELFIDTLRNEFGCNSSEFERISNEFLKSSNVLLKKFVIKMETRSIVPGEFDSLLDKIEKSSFELFQEVDSLIGVKA